MSEHLGSTTYQRAERVLRRLDLNNDGRISLEEFTFGVYGHSAESHADKTESEYGLQNRINNQSQISRGDTLRSERSQQINNSGNNYNSKPNLNSNAQNTSNKQSSIEEGQQKRPSPSRYSKPPARNPQSPGRQYQTSPAIDQNRYRSERLSNQRDQGITASNRSNKYSPVNASLHNKHTYGAEDSKAESVAQSTSGNNNNRDKQALNNAREKSYYDSKVNSEIRARDSDESKKNKKSTTERDSGDKNESQKDRKYSPTFKKTYYAEETLEEDEEGNIKKTKYTINTRESPKLDKNDKNDNKFDTNSRSNLSLKDSYQAPQQTSSANRRLAS